MAKRVGAEEMSGREMWDQAVATAAAMVRTPNACRACPTLEQAHRTFDELSGQEDWVEIRLPTDTHPRFSPASEIHRTTRIAAPASGM